MIAAAFVLALGHGQARAQDGAQIFKTNCTVCHSAEPGQSKIGPPLFGVVGRKAGTAPNYVYSGAMKNSGLTWTPSQLEIYLANPMVVVPNTKMLFVGLKNAADRKALIDYLGALK
jgi:cytochrome c